MEKKTGKKLNLTKKQFIIAIAAVCGIALIIEAALLVHTFSKEKNKEKKKGPSGEKEQQQNVIEISGYVATTCRYEDGKRILEKINTVEVDESGRLVHEHTYRSAELRGEEALSDEDVVYTYDEQGRLIKEEHTTNRQLSETEKYRFEYEYGGPMNSSIPLTVTKKKIDETGKKVEEEEFWYDTNDRLHIYIKYVDGRMVIEEGLGHNKNGNLTSYFTTKQDEFYAEYDWAAKVSSRFYQGELVGKCYFDGEDRLIRYEEINSDGDVQYYMTYEYASGPVCTKCFRRNGIDGSPVYEKFFDESGRISRTYWYGGYFTEFFDWDYEDPELPGRKVFRCTTYDGRVETVTGAAGEVMRDFRYLIIPMDEAALEAEHRKEDKEPFAERYAFLQTDAYPVVYVTTDGYGHECGWTLYGYSYMDYTLGEDGYAYSKPEFEEGRIKSIFVNNEIYDAGDCNQLLKFDDRERIVSLQEVLKDGTIIRETVYEYGSQTDDSKFSIGNP